MGHLRLASLFAVWVFLARSASAMPSAVMLPAADAAANITPAHSVVASTGPTVSAPPSSGRADGCALLPVAEIGKVLGEPFRGPSRQPAPPLYPDAAKGTECDYGPKQPIPAAGVYVRVRFIVYVESSAALARSVFTKARADLARHAGRTTPVAGIGDSAYRDTYHALHVLKGQAHFDLHLLPKGTLTSQMVEQEGTLAAWVAGHL